MQDAKDYGGLVVVPTRDSPSMQVLQMLATKLGGFLLVVRELALREIEFSIELVSRDETGICYRALPAVSK